jgi:hypothetical protein
MSPHHPHLFDAAAQPAGGAALGVIPLLDLNASFTEDVVAAVDARRHATGAGASRR